MTPMGITGCGSGRKLGHTTAGNKRTSEAGSHIPWVVEVQLRAVFPIEPSVECAGYSMRVNAEQKTGMRFTETKETGKARLTA